MKKRFLNGATGRTSLWPIKRFFGYTHFLLKGLAKVGCEWRLMTLAHNLKRVLNLVRFGKLMAAVGVKAPAAKPALRKRS